MVLKSGDSFTMERKKKINVQAVKYGMMVFHTHDSLNGDNWK